jgi:WD40 repeat protein/serine/threonine protein kinase
VRADPRVVRDLFLAAAELPAADRDGYLTQHCGGDAELRAAVERLLAAHEQPASVLDWAPASAPTEVFVPVSEQPGSKVGAYKLMELIGEGGFGLVYVAEQTQPVRRKVALKLIKPGMDSKQVIARFEAERQALALMDHPNIARVLDAGTTETGLPYFVMELVRGIPITEYCDKNQLTPNERLELFISVCHAIQHAHQKGIIHRDIKPSNVLVGSNDGKPMAKVIDFGIARAISQDLSTGTVYTNFAQMIGTPLYMSPEQAEMSVSDIDTRSDIYSLGVLLYELLTGSTPLDKKRITKAAQDEIRRMIREDEPPRPSYRLSTCDTLPSLAASRRTEPVQLSRMLKGELDWVVMKALEKDRTRRYETASGLARDIQRYLDDEVVEARPPTATYRMQKFVRRHKVQVVAGSLLLLVLLAGIAGTTTGLIAAKRQEAAARLFADEAHTQAKLASDNAMKAESEAQTARRAEQEARDRAAAEAEAKALALHEKQRADDNARKAEIEAQAARRAEEEAKAQLARAEWLVYAGKLSLAQNDFETGAGALALAYLGECQWNLRGWEHRCLWTRVNARQTLQNDSGVACVAISPDGKQIVSGDQNASVKLWDAATGQLLRVLKGHTNPVRGVAFSRDGGRIATGDGAPGRPTEVKVWDAATDLEVVNMKGLKDEVNSVAFSPDGKRLVTGGGNRNGTAGQAQVWDAVTGQELLSFKGYNSPVTCVAYSPDGQQIVTSDWQPTARVWNAGTGEELFALKGHKNRVLSAAYSPDGKHVVTGSDDLTAKVWNAATGEQLLDLRGHTAPISCVAYSPDGKRIVAGSWNGTVKVWDAETGQEVLVLKGHAGEVSRVTFTPDGKRLVTSSWDRTVKIWDAERGQKNLVLTGHVGLVRRAAFSPDSKRIVTARGVWDAATGEHILALAGAAGPVAYRFDGNRIVTGSYDNTAKVWDAATGQSILTLSGHAGQVLSAAFSPDGKRIATAAQHANEPGAVRVWDAESGQELLALKVLKGRVWCVAFSPDGKRIATGDDQAARVWDAATGQEVFVLKSPPAEVWSVAFSSDGKQILTGSLDRAVRLWDAESGQIVLTLNGHTQGVWSAAFSPDGKRIFSGGDDSTVRVWDAGKGQELVALKAAAGVLSVAISPDGKRLVTGQRDGTAEVWSAETGQEPRTLAELTESLRERFPYLLRNADQPADDAERLGFAHVAFEQKKFALAAGLAAEALASNPKLGDDRQALHRYTAARAALLAAAGRGRDEAPLDEPAKSRLRGQALDWLEAELGACAISLESGPPHARLTILLTLSGWKYDGDLADIRDATALAGFPVEEQRRVTKFWAELSALLKAGNARHAALLQGQLTEAWKALSKDDPNLAALLAQIGRACLEQEQWAEAEPFLGECLAIREKIQPDAWATFNTQSSLGESLLGQKKYAEAEALLLKGYEGMKAREATIPPLAIFRLPETCERLIDLYTATNRPDDVKKWQAERAIYNAQGPSSRQAK